MTAVSRAWLPEPEDPLQRAVVLRLRDVPDGEVTAVARALVRARGQTLQGEAGRRHLQTARRQVSRWRSGEKPDLPLSTVTQLARALGDDALKLLGYDRAALRAEADAAESAAFGGGGGKKAARQ